MWFRKGEKIIYPNDLSPATVVQHIKLISQALTGVKLEFKGASYSAGICPSTL